MNILRHLSPRRRVALTIVVPFIVQAVLYVVALWFFDRPIYNNLRLASPFVSLAAGSIWFLPEYVALARGRTFTIAASLIAPPFLFVALFVVREEMRGPVPVSSEVAWWPLIGCLSVGFLFLVRVFRVYAIPLSLIYLPMTWLSTVYVGYLVALSYGYG